MVRKIFYSFHFKNDVHRVQQIRNIGLIEGNKPVTAQKWEEVKNQGDHVVERWIDENMKGKSCVVVLIGEETANRKWVKYEIKKAWEDGKGLLGIHIHNIKCMNNGTCTKGPNPFDQFKFNGKLLSSIVNTYDPPSWNAYGDISDYIPSWIDKAIEIRNAY